MDDFPKHQTWQHTLAVLALISSPPRFDDKKDSSGRLHGRSAAKERGPNGRAPRSHASAFIEILERRSATSIVVCWRDATSGRFGDQLWTLGVASRGSICALSDAQIRRGDAVYRPCRRGHSHACNADQSILASALLTNEQGVAAPDGQPCSEESDAASRLCWTKKDVCNAI
jgi:hypothetical protein